ncbi:MAG: DUF1818 family protein [Scytolyngbya sp. HA4215-MV1]|jgi:hypothetical protein|nr:DUF1818 family protein [Scytolyngbya sp. HA4215-MV1]
MLNLHSSTARVIKQGQGWRLGWNPAAPKYKGLVGGENWAIELTEAELNDFCRLVVQLSDTMRQVAAELMDEEAIACEVESDLLWLEAQGYPDHYGLQVIVLSDRQAEGVWSAAAVPELIQAAQMLGVF